MSVDVARTYGQLIITRALQVIGEYLKNTKDYPKLSDATNELLHSALPSDLKKIVTELRDCLSHAESLCLRSDIEESGQNFFTSVQYDINQMNLAVNDIFRVKNAEIIGIILSKLIDCRDLYSMELFLKENFITPLALRNELEEAENFSIGNVEKLEKLFANQQRESERDFNHAKNLCRRIHDIIREDYQSASYNCTSKSMTLSAATDEITQICEDFVTYKKSILSNLKTR
ncbi:hypothetical protein AVEN_177900-1 [Araneus ventricosus]|uniref:Uncharacterized protein n=1 Tax=Araneus ventricosus TaxID=182803 RepID=A0A4Y2KDC7_ARAVE|nr:hypothetical protein AVEN_177900-1 [Araneus ventricosus]